MTEPPAELVELMAAAGYEAYRTNGTSLPPWQDCNEHYRDAGRREMTAALRAAERAGYRITKFHPSSPPSIDHDQDHQRSASER